MGGISAQFQAASRLQMPLRNNQRLELCLQGHAGTVPMNMRKDPMAAAAEIIHWIEKRCGGGRFARVVEGVQAEDNLMCTTGNINLWPNAFNVIPGSANFTLDIR